MPTAPALPSRSRRLTLQTTSSSSGAARLRTSVSCLAGRSRRLSGRAPRSPGSSRRSPSSRTLSFEVREESPHPTSTLSPALAPRAFFLLGHREDRESEGLGGRTPVPPRQHAALGDRKRLPRSRCVPSAGSPGRTRRSPALGPAATAAPGASAAAARAAGLACLPC